MYLVTIINDGQEKTIHSPVVNDIKLTNGVIKEEINKHPTFNIEFTPNNPAFGQLRPLKTFINVLNTLTNKYVFEGRVLAPTDDMADNGLHSTAFECEGELAYLHDSQQRHLEYRGTPRNLLKIILEYHNQQVEDYKHFELGEVTVTNSTDNLYVYLSAEMDTYDTISDKLIDRIGGELQIRKENGVRYLDLIDRIGKDSSTEIRIAKNLKSISRDRDPTEIITRLTPLGTRIESEDETATDASQARLTIEEVNNGIPYIDDPALIAEFGIQGGSVTWDDITIPSNLLSTGRNWMRNQKTSYTQYTLNVVDLSIIGKDEDSFDTGNTYPVFNPVMGIDERLRVVGKTIDINAPEADSLTIGDKFKTLKEYEAEMQKSTQKVFELEDTVARQSQAISNIRNEVVNVEGNLEVLQQAIRDADLEELPGAISALEQAINNLNDALDGIPIYDVATHTQDGLMASADKIKLDSLQNYSEATEFTTGLLSAEDKQKLNRITVSQNVNLDDILARLEALETQ